LAHGDDLHLVLAHPFFGFFYGAFGHGQRTVQIGARAFFFTNAIERAEVLLAQFTEAGGLYVHQDQLPFHRFGAPAVAIDPRQI